MPYSLGFSIVGKGFSLGPGGGEILLGVSPDGINYLTSVSKDGSPKSQQAAIPQMPAGFPMQFPQEQAPATARQEAPRRLSPSPQPKAKVPSAASNVASQDPIKVYKNSEPAKRDATTKSIDDVRKIIRNKLKDLPTS